MEAVKTCTCKNVSQYPWTHEDECALSKRKHVNWYKLHGSQEISTRLGYKNDERFDNLEEQGSVCCQEVYDIAWEAEKEMYKLWKECGKINRNPHISEFMLIFEDKDIPHPFFEHPKFRSIAFNAKEKIKNFYLEQLGRYPDEWEILAAFNNCQIDPNFHFDYSLQHGTDEYNKKNWEERCRKDAFDFVEKVEIGKCVLCGKPVFTYDEMETLDGAGEIKMSFGYGSTRDLDSGKGYIHDNCSFELDRKIFKNCLNWGDERRNISVLEAEEVK